MSSVDGVLFKTMTDADWRRSIARRRARRNLIAAQIRAALGKPISAASGGTVAGKEDGFGNASAGQPPLARGVFFPSTPRILSPVAPITNTMTSSDAPADDQGAAGGPRGDGQFSEAAPYSCAVGSATAGRDRRFFVQ